MSLRRPISDDTEFEPWKRFIDPANGYDLFDALEEYVAGQVATVAGQVDSVGGQLINLRQRSLADIRASLYDGTARITSGVGSGVFDPDPTDATSTDDGGALVIVATDGTRYKRRWDGRTAHLGWWGITTGTAPATVRSTVNTALLTLSTRFAGAALRIPAGTWFLDNQISVPSDVILEGVPGASVLKLASTNAAGNVITNRDTVNGNSRVTIRGLVLDANRVERTPASSTYGGGSEANIGGPIYWRSTGAGTWSEDVTITGCTLRNSPFQGAYVYHMRRFRFVSNYVLDTMRDGVCLYEYNEDCWIVDNRFEQIGDDCVGLNTEASTTTTNAYYISNVDVSGNQCHHRDDCHNGNGLRIGGVKDVTVRGNRIGPSFDSGILLEGGHASGSNKPSYRVSIVGNTILNSGQGSVYWSDSAHTNVAYQQRGSGINVRDSSQGITIDANTIEGATNHGISIATGCDVTLTGNHIRSGRGDANSFGINCAASHTVITGNRLRDVQGHGIALYANGCSVTGNVIRDCSRSNANGSYILLTAGVGRTTVTGNSMSRNPSFAYGAYGVQVASGGGDFSSVMGNTVTGFSPGNGIRNSSAGAFGLTNSAAAAAATTITLTGGTLPVSIPEGEEVVFGIIVSGTMTQNIRARLSATANTGASSLTVHPLSEAIPAGYTMHRTMVLGNISNNS